MVEPPIWGIWHRARNEWWSDRSCVVFVTASRAHADAQWRLVVMQITPARTDRAEWTVKQLGGAPPHEVK